LATDRFFNDPDFIKYVRLLYDLHVAIREGWDESSKGEVLRDRMEDPGSRLSGEEIVSLNGISADFYSLTDESITTLLPITADVMADLDEAVQARESREFDKALRLLRKHSRNIPPASLAYLRGRTWMAAGEYQIASAFLQRASDLDPENSNFTYVALHCLSLADPAAAVERSQTSLSNSEESPLRLILKAADILSQHSGIQQEEGSSRELRSLIPILESSIFRLETSGEAETNPELLGRARGLVDSSSRLIHPA
jgi:tetratricopeptide (TPR) repeat protein